MADSLQPHDLPIHSAAAIRIAAVFPHDWQQILRDCGEEATWPEIVIYLLERRQRERMILSIVGLGTFSLVMFLISGILVLLPLD